MGATAAIALEAIGMEAATAATVAEVGSVAATAGAAYTGYKALTSKSPVPAAPQTMRMPDPLEQQAARQKSIAEMMARRGRQASIVTQPADGKLGG